MGRFKKWLRRALPMFSWTVSKEELLKRIGKGVPLFRISHPFDFFEEIARLEAPHIPYVTDRRVWGMRGIDCHFAYIQWVDGKGGVETIVRMDNGDWRTWDWEQILDIAATCGWRGFEVEPLYIDLEDPLHNIK